MTEVESACIEIAAKHAASELDAEVTEFQLIYRGTDPESGLHIVDASYKADLEGEAVFPGGGSDKSRQLHIDVKADKVTAALRFQ